MNIPNDFSELIDKFIELIDAALPVVGGLALLVFIWGLAKFIFRVGGDEKAVAEGKSLMIWGIIALFILVSFWGIIEIFHEDVGFGPFINVPYLPQN
jgi:hypothetical protein